MLKDEVSVKSKNKKVVEIFVDNMWILAMATDLRIMDRNRDLVRVKAVRVRTLNNGKKTDTHGKGTKT